jgi:hypothetical protein
VALPIAGAGYYYCRLAKISSLSANTRHSTTLPSRIAAFQAAGVRHEAPSIVPSAAHTLTPRHLLPSHV